MTMHARPESRGRPNGEAGRLPHSGDHVAQFFVDEDGLVERISALGAGALSMGDAFILLATSEHAQAVERKIGSLAIDLVSARSTGRYAFLDAHELLARIVPGDVPSAVLFGEIVGSAVARAVAQHRQLVVYGELVSLLWSAGRRDAAIRVEELWNELMRLHPFALVCGYPFDGALDAPGFALISEVHDRMEPPPAPL